MKNTNILKSLTSDINWEEIQKLYKKLNIVWNIEVSPGTFESKIPEISDLKDEVKQLIEFLYESGDDYISYGNWIIFFDKDNNNVRIIFRLADITIGDKPKKEFKLQEDYDIRSLEDKLNLCVLNEKYEEAASIRDKINFLRGI